MTSIAGNRRKEDAFCDQQEGIWEYGTWEKHMVDSECNNNKKNEGDVIGINSFLIPIGLEVYSKDLLTNAFDEKCSPRINRILDRNLLIIIVFLYDPMMTHVIERRNNHPPNASLLLPKTCHHNFLIGGINEEESFSV